MKVLSTELRRTVETAEALAVIANLQDKGRTVHPFLESPPLLLRRARRGIETSGAVLLALTIAVLVLLINFVLFVRILHFS